jgi:hypothetical protein
VALQFALLDVVAFNVHLWGLRLDCEGINAEEGSSSLGLSEGTEIEFRTSETGMFLVQ